MNVDAGATATNLHAAAAETYHGFVRQRRDQQTRICSSTLKHTSVFLLFNLRMDVVVVGITVCKDLCVFSVF